MTFRSKENIENIRSMPCSICMFPQPSDPHHWKSKGSGGDDSLDNLVSLCHPHHQEFHNTGRTTFFNKYGTKINNFRKRNQLPEIKETK